LLIIFFIISWISVFEVAYMNGDDVVHFAQQNYRDIFFPKLYASWVPNRVIDFYGRTILTSFFNFLYSAANTSGHISFFDAYKIFSATLFSIFTAHIFWYFVRAIPATRINKTFRFIFIITIGILILQMFFWRNQVHFICYQLPAWLTFISLKMVFDCKYSNLSESNFTAAIYLSFVSSFSLESNSLTIFCFSFLLFFIEIYNQHLIKLNFKGNLFNVVKNSQYLKLLVINFSFSFISIIVSIIFSARTAVSFLANNISLFYHNFLLQICFLIFVIIIFSMLLSFKYEMQRPSSHKKFDFRFLSLLILLTLIITIPLSLITNNNYFSNKFYPWGDMMLVGKISALAFLGMLVNLLVLQKKILNPFIAILMFVFLSNQIIAWFDRTKSNAIISQQVSSVYMQVTLKFEKNNQDINTGLKLETIPMQIRPFPSASSPEWFRQGYQYVFREYYGIVVLPNFK
jgi:hypothetical protein